MPLPAPAQQEDLLSYDLRRAEELLAAGDAEAAAKYSGRAVRHAEDLLADRPDQRATVYTLHGVVLLRGGDVDGAGTALERALAATRQASRTGPAALATAIENLAMVRAAAGRTPDAVPLLEEAAALRERRAPDLALAATLDALGSAYQRLARPADAVSAHARAVAVAESVAGADDPRLAVYLNNHAAALVAAGERDAAADLYRRALVLTERALGPDDPEVAAILANMGRIAYEAERFDEAASLYRRALAIQSAARAAEDPALATTRSNLGLALLGLGDVAGAVEHVLAALEARERTLGASHPEIAQLTNQMGQAMFAAGALDVAERLFARALAIGRDSFGADSPAAATALSNLAGVDLARGRHADALDRYARALEIWRARLGPEDSSVGVVLENLALLHDRAGRTHDAVDAIREAARIADREATRAGATSASLRARFAFQARLSVAAARERGAASARLTEEGFVAAQRARASRAATAMAQMAARFAAGNDTLASLIRERQDAAARWSAIDEDIRGGVSAGAVDAADVRRLRETMTALDASIAAIDARIDTEFPTYGGLSRPEPMTTRAARAWLGPDEALVAYLFDGRGGLAWVVTADAIRAVELDIDAETLADAVARLRAGLDFDRARRGEDGLPLYPIAVAHDVYRRVVAPLEPHLGGARRLLVVADGALESLPLAALVTDPPPPGSRRAARYAETGWLGARYAFASLPSIDALNALRAIGTESRASEPFLGVGDPDFAGTGGTRSLPALETLFTARGLADVELLRQAPRLPETADELRAIARFLGAGDEAVILGAAASERRLRSTPVDRYRVIAFATHALTAGELGANQAEPALLLTPPRTASLADDGLLTASEIAQLDLDADWVVLSACNTAAADGRGDGGGFSGLARAFIYAGSRALLVSHWPVESHSAAKLTTGLFAARAADGDLTRSGALKRSMDALRAEADTAHPIFWAPFVVVGDGR